MDLSCFNTQDGAIELGAISNAVAPYQVQLTSQPGDSVVGYSNLPAGNYELLVTDYYGCTFRQILTVNAPPPYIVDVGPDLSIALGDLVQVNAQVNGPFQSLAWNHPEQIMCEGDDCLRPLWYPLESDTFTLTAVFADDCIASDTLIIEVRKERRVYFPNAFSPNDDGVNDRFTVYGQQPNVQSIQRLTVFDRWGGLIYDATDLSPNDLSTGWDGKVKGKPADAGVYVYMAEVLFLDGLVEVYSGSVSLLR